MSVFGGSSSIFVLTGGKLVGFGGNSHFQLGQGNDMGNKPGGVEIEIPGNPTIIRFNNGFVSRTTIVLTTAGLFGCGRGWEGQFGDGTTKSRRSMKLLEFYQNKGVESFFSEEEGLWVVLKDQTVFRSGDNIFGNLGNGTRSEVHVPQQLDKSFLTSKEERVVDIKGYYHTFLLTDKGFVYACGSGSCGRRGMGEGDIDISVRFERIQTMIEKGKGMVIKIAIGLAHSLFVTSREFAFSCGRGGSGQNGHNKKRDRYIPGAVEFLWNQKIKKIVCGQEFSMFLTRKNFVFGCGENRSFQIPTGKNRSVFVPTKVSTFLLIVDLATTTDSTTFVTSTGEIFSCGHNSQGECCIGNTSTPVKVLTKSKFTIAELKGLTLYEKLPKFLADAIVVSGVSH